jgi:hypothetical protein
MAGLQVGPAKLGAPKPGRWRRRPWRLRVRLQLVGLVDEARGNGPIGRSSWPACVNWWLGGRRQTAVQIHRAEARLQEAPQPEPSRPPGQAPGSRAARRMEMCREAGQHRQPVVPRRYDVVVSRSGKVSPLLTRAGARSLAASSSGLALEIQIASGPPWRPPCGGELVAGSQKPPVRTQQFSAPPCLLERIEAIWPRGGE